VTVTVPGNLLLMGEYAVLEEGGLGVAAAIDRRVRIGISPDRGIRIEGSWPGGAFAWTPADPRASPLASAAVQCVEGWLRENGLPPPRWAARIRADSAALFAPDGRKRGLGASAAVCVGLVAALLKEAGQAGERAAKAAPALAVRAHRGSQGGRGSGYDVLCSFHGALGLFHGGRDPSWEACRLQWDAALFLFPGPASISTVDAVQRYSAWKERNPRAAREFLEDSNRCVREFLRAGSATASAAPLRDCRRLGIAIGQAIGVPAKITAPMGFDPERCKALGAGDELGACIMPEEAAPQADSASFERAEVSERGIAWEE
jgi:phosphomevalonate kinase